MKLVRIKYKIMVKRLGKVIRNSIKDKAVQFNFLIVVKDLKLMIQKQFLQGKALELEFPPYITLVENLMDLDAS